MSVHCFRFMTGENVKTEVGREFDQRAYLDMYIDDLKWGIELIRCGTGKRLEEHVQRFSLTDGRYTYFIDDLWALEESHCDNTLFSTSLTRSQTNQLLGCLASCLQRYVYQSYSLSKGPYRRRLGPYRLSGAYGTLALVCCFAELHARICLFIRCMSDVVQV